MDCMEALLGRRSCRNFKPDPIEKEKVLKMLEAATYAPSPAHKQPWEFIVVNNLAYNKKIKEHGELVKAKVAERSGWTWLPSFNIDFLMQSPTMIVVLADPSKYGGEHFLDEPSLGYLEGCACAVQNMMLAAHAQGLGTLWWSLFEKKDVRKIFGISEDKDPIGIVCVGYPQKLGNAPVRKSLEEKVRYID